jgi:hypothetical protein
MAHIGVNSKANTPIGQYRRERIRNKALHTGSLKPTERKALFHPKRQSRQSTGKEPKRNESQPNRSKASTAKQATPPTVALTINSRGYDFLRQNAKRSKLPREETITENCRILQVCGVAYLNFKPAKRVEKRVVLI